MKNRWQRTPVSLAVCSMVASAAGMSAVATASEPVSGEFLVNEQQRFSQSSPKVARSADGRSVVLWNNQATGLVMARLFDANGTPITGEFPVSDLTVRRSDGLDVAMDADGDFVVVWNSYPDVPGTYGTAGGILARVFDRDGTPVSSEITVNNVTAREQRDPTVAMDADGDFVVAWSTNPTDQYNDYDIAVRRFNAAGAPQSNQVRVNGGNGDGNQRKPDIAVDATGNFVVAWESYEATRVVRARRYNAAGAAQGGVFRVDSSADGALQPTVAMDASGDFVVVWMDRRGERRGDPTAYECNYSNYGIFARRYNAAGAAQTGDFVINEQVCRSSQNQPSVAMDADGDFVVAWAGYRHAYYSGVSTDATSYDIVARRFSALGAPQTDEMLVNVTTPGSQRFPAVAMDSDGDFLVAWAGRTYFGYSSSYQVYARRYRGGEPIDLAVDVSAPGAITPSRRINYSVTAFNNQSPAVVTGIPAIDTHIGVASNLLVFMQLPANASFISGSGSDWQCDNASGFVTCDYAGLLAPGAMAPVLSISALGPEADADDSVTTLTELTAAQIDPDLDNNTEQSVTGVTCDRGVLALTVDSLSVMENGTGFAEVAVSRDGGVCGSAAVTLVTSDGTAIAGVDYTAVSQTVSWASGEGGVKIVQVPILDDNLDELDEFVNTALINPVGAELGARTSANFTILDNDVAEVNFSVAAQTVGEADGNASVTVTTSVPSTRDIIVTFNTSGTAVQGKDMQRSIRSIRIPAGALSRSASIPLINDNVREADDTLVLTMDLAPIAVIGAINTHTITIVDDDPIPTLSFEREIQTVNEGETRNVRVLLSNPIDETVTVNYTIGAGTTMDPSEYSVLPSSPLQIRPGQTQVRMTVSSIDDTETEPVESLFLELQVPENVLPGAITQYQYRVRASD